MEVVVWLIIILIGIAALLSFVFAHMITHGKRQTLDESWEWELSHVPAVRKFSRDMLTDYVIKGPKGEDIHVALLVFPETSDKYVILAHGYTDNRFGMMKHMTLCGRGKDGKRLKRNGTNNMSKDWRGF